MQIKLHICLFREKDSLFEQKQRFTQHMFHIQIRKPLKWDFCGAQNVVLVYVRHN